MATYTQILYHIVFSTKDRRPCLIEEGREAFLRYLWGIIKNKQCHLYRINAVSDHLHILSDLHPSVCLADLIKDIKVASSQWIKKGGVFAGFDHWQDGYGAFTHSLADKDRLVRYIKGQADHHATASFHDELKALLREAGIEYEEAHLS